MFLVDVCISSSLGNKTIALANKNSFKSIKLKPNYSFLFYNTVINCNKKTSELM